MVIAIPGRSFLRGEVERDELLAHARDFEASRYLFTNDMADWMYDVRLVEGDLEIDGSLDLFEEQLAGLVVTGSLVLRGCYSDGDDPECGVVVLGDMEADSIVTGGWLNVGGSLVVHGGLVGDHNDCAATIGGHTRARFLHTEEHWFTFGGDVHVDIALGRPRGAWPTSTELRELPASKYPDLLLPEVFHLEGAKGKPFDSAALSPEELADLDDLLQLNHQELMRRTRLHEPVFL